jgi:anthranilate synthase/aminodeoxychorismate synthase-like glutamine amidotransferase
MILIIDNYDSFVYNLARYVRELGYSCLVKRNDQISLEHIKQLQPSHLILSPGPCTPFEAGICIDAIKTFGAEIPLLGVCLGHQAIGAAFGATITRATYPRHGKASFIQHNEEGLFKNLPNPLKVARYHSLIVKNDSPDLVYTAFSSEGEVMALQHKQYPIYGVQFHPESILTEHGYDLLKQFLAVSQG